MPTSRPTQHEIFMPDLGLGDMAVVVSQWLVPNGAPVTAGDRVLEVMAEAVTVDIAAPATGVLIEKRVSEDEPLLPGQVLGIIVPS